MDTEVWHNVYITDKSGEKMWNTTASPMSTMSEVKNLQRHLDQAKKYPERYAFLDVASAVVMLDGQAYPPNLSDSTPLEMSDDELLAELFA